MAPAKTNFKTYESMYRLLAAVVATSGGKLDFKAIAQHFGSDMTAVAAEHRFRPIRKLAKEQASCVENNKDPKEISVEKGEADTKAPGNKTASAKKVKASATSDEQEDIHSLFGDSTPAGIEFQFRDIRKLGEAQKAAKAKGEDTSAVGPQSIGNAAASSKASKKAATTPASRKGKSVVAAAVDTPGTETPTGKRSTVNGKKRAAVKFVSDDESVDMATAGSVKRTLKEKAAAALSPGYIDQNVDINVEGVSRSNAALFGNLGPNYQLPDLTMEKPASDPFERFAQPGVKFPTLDLSSPAQPQAKKSKTTTTTQPSPVQRRYLSNSFSGSMSSYPPENADTSFGANGANYSFFKDAAGDYAQPEQWNEEA